LQHLLFIFILIFLFACAKQPAEEISEAIDIALTHLSKSECDEAIKVLERTSSEGEDAVYLQVLASAYACKANFDEVKFISEDLDDINTSTPASIFASISILSLSEETQADSEDFTSVKKAINILLASSSQTERTQKFGARKAGDMGVQALILSIVNLGKFLNFYGNVNASGAKGLGSGAHKCFLNYSDSRAQLLTGVSTGACLLDNDGQDDLDKTTVVGKRRMCEGLMLLTNTLDILENIDLSTSDSLSKLEVVASQVGTFKTAAVTAGLGTMINMKSQSECETYLNTPSKLLDMEYLYVLLFETGLQ
jgi:hypothetical protein